MSTRSDGDKFTRYILYLSRNSGNSFAVAQVDHATAQEAIDNVADRTYVERVLGYTQARDNVNFNAGCQGGYPFHTVGHKVAPIGLPLKTQAITDLYS